MVAAVHYYATTVDQQHLLDYLGEPVEVALRPWPIAASPPAPVEREVALSLGQVMVVSRAVGEPSTVRPGAAASDESSTARVFNRINWDRLSPDIDEGLVDSNASPVLLSTPATRGPEGLRSGSIGSQADSMRAISKDYERWVNRVMNRVRSQGTRVWGLEQHKRSDLDLRRSDVTTIYALPDALTALDGGAPGL